MYSDSRCTIFVCMLRWLSPSHRDCIDLVRGGKYTINSTFYNANGFFRSKFSVVEITTLLGSSSPFLETFCRADPRPYKILTLIQPLTLKLVHPSALSTSMGSRADRYTLLLPMESPIMLLLSSERMAMMMRKTAVTTTTTTTTRSMGAQGGESGVGRGWVVQKKVRFGSAMG